ncbi:MAG TPA: flagellar basal body protein [Kofleriaceae bacterium]
MSSDFSTVDQLANAMTFHRERHAVLAGNVANVDTPGYRPYDITQHEADGGQLELAAPEGAALQPGAEPGAAYAKTFDDGGNLAGPDGNAVSMERELAKMDANRTRYATAAELVSRRMAMLKYAAGDGSGG